MAQSKQGEDGNPERAMAGKEIAEALARAQSALNAYDHTRKRLAAQGVDPDSQHQTYDALITLDAAVHDAYTKLRKYIKDDLEEQWWNTKILGYVDDGQTPIVLGGNEGEQIDIEDEKFSIQTQAHPDQVKFIEDFAGEIEEIEEERFERFEGWTTKTTLQPALMPVKAYRRAIQYLDEIRNDLGFAPEATESTPRTEITDEMIEDVWEWEQENLPDDVLEARE